MGHIRSAACQQHAAGLLQGLKATTHWGSFTELETFGATYVRERFVVQGRIITAAGVSAGIDMALWLARKLADEPLARTIQLAIEYDPAPPFAMPTPPTRHEELSVYDWQILEQRAGQRHHLDPRPSDAPTPAVATAAPTMAMGNATPAPTMAMGEAMPVTGTMTMDSTAMPMGGAMPMTATMAMGGMDMQPGQPVPTLTPGRRPTLPRRSPISPPSL